MKRAIGVTTASTAAYPRIASSPRELAREQPGERRQQEGEECVHADDAERSAENEAEDVQPDERDPEVDRARVLAARPADGRVRIVALERGSRRVVPVAPEVAVVLDAAVERQPVEREEIPDEKRRSDGNVRKPDARGEPVESPRASNQEERERGGEGVQCDAGQPPRKLGRGRGVSQSWTRLTPKN